MRLLIAIPCLNEEKSIYDLILRIPKNIAGVTERVVLVINDGSTDASEKKAREAGAIVLSHHRNLGLGAAFQSAVGYALFQGFSIMVTMDADGQFDPVEIEKLLTPIINEGADFVSGSRFLSDSYPENMSKTKIYGNHLMTFFVKKLTGHNCTDVSCGFRAFSREALYHLNLHGKFTYTQETFIDLSQKNLHISEVPIKVKYFIDRKSRVASNLFKYGFKTAKIIIRAYRDYAPLKFFWWTAFLFVLPAIPTSAIFLTHYFETGMFYGQLWAGFTAASLLFVSLTLVVLGTLADILVRMRMNQERTLYLIKKEMRSNSTVDNRVR